MRYRVPDDSVAWRVTDVWESVLHNHGLDIVRLQAR